MSTIKTKDAPSVKSMRWVARILSILWAIWALFWTLFISAADNDEVAGILLAGLVVVIAILLFLGPAIISIKWRREALAGSVLLVDGILILASLVAIYFHIAPRNMGGVPPPMRTEAQVAFFTLILPPLVAGSLFLACHRLSKASEKQNA